MILNLVRLMLIDRLRESEQIQKARKALVCTDCGNMYASNADQQIHIRSKRK